VTTVNRTATALAIASGKGGVGKTTVAVNLAVAFARLGHRVSLVDADFGLGNVDVFLGLTPERHIGQLLSGDATLDELLVTGPAGVKILPASSGLRELTALTPAQLAIITDTFFRLRSSFDYLLIDTAAGISDTVIDTMLLADRVIVVTSVEPAAIVDAYATVKVLNHASPDMEIGIVVNSVRSSDEALMAFRQLDMAAKRFLGRSLKFFGFVTSDASVRDAVVTQRSIVEHMPQADASRCFRMLAARLAGLGPAEVRSQRPFGARALASVAAGEVEGTVVPMNIAEVPPCA